MDFYTSLKTSILCGDVFGNSKSDWDSSIIRRSCFYLCTQCLDAGTAGAKSRELTSICSLCFLHTSLRWAPERSAVRYLMVIYQLLFTCPFSGLLIRTLSIADCSRPQPHMERWRCCLGESRSDV